MTATQNAPAEVSSRLVEQDRGYAAMRAVTEARNEAKQGKINYDDYESRSRSLPAMIQNLGLASTVAFLLSKQRTRTADAKLADHLGSWLLSQQAQIGWPQAAAPGPELGETGKELERMLCQPGTTSLIYRRASHEARLYAGWLKRWSSVKA